MFQTQNFEKVLVLWKSRDNALEIIGVTLSFKLEKVVGSLSATCHIISYIIYHIISYIISII